jgi:hypothetical protein
MSHIQVTYTGNDKKKEHNLKALKRSEKDDLRQLEIKSERLLYVWDRVCVNLPQWVVWKKNGIYFLTRNKKNLNLELVKTIEIDT